MAHVFRQVDTVMVPAHSGVMRKIRSWSNVFSGVAYECSSIIIIIIICLKDDRLVDMLELLTVQLYKMNACFKRHTRNV